MFLVEELSQKKGASMTQIAMAWSLSKDGELPVRLLARVAEQLELTTGVTAPIVGTTSLKNSRGHNWYVVPFTHPSLS